MGKDKEPWPTGRYLGMLHSFARRYFKRAMQEYDLPGRSIMFLGYLGKHEGVSQDDIASHFLFNKGSVARVLDQLEDADMVERRVDEEDRRINRVYLTEHGREKRKEFKKVAREWSRQLTEGFSEQEEETLLDFLERMAQNAADYLEAEGDDVSHRLRKHSD